MHVIIILENDHHLKFLQTVFWKLYLFPSWGIKGGNVSVQWGPFIKSHSCSLNPVSTNRSTFLYLQLMLETGPVLETLCLEELKKKDIFQNISHTSCNNVHS